LCGQFATQRGDRDAVDESALAVDLDNGQPLAVGRLEPGIAGDVDLAVVDVFRVEGLPCRLAEVATEGGVEDDARDRCRG
jgi:hypothetical protein